VPYSHLHPLLARQLKRSFGAIDRVPPALQPFVAAVNDAYKQADVDRQMLERSLELSSEELRDANRGLSQAVRGLQEAQREMERRVDERTRELDTANEYLRQAQKMEAIGTLAGGIAHDFNNLLMVIDGSVGMLLSARSDADAALPELDEIRRATDRATELTQQLLAFGRKQVMAPRTVDLNQIVLDMQRMLSRLVREDIALVAVTAKEPAWVRIDPNQIEQVLLNMVLNSRDALPDGGQIRVEVSRGRATGDEPGSLGSVSLIVADNGIGMPPDVRARVFEPFFSTKAGKGSGLGLASAHGIVHQSNGVIFVESTENVGTTFTMRFPAVPPAVSIIDHVERSPVANTRADRLLLVEDEDPVRKVLRKLLESRGFHVTEAATPHEACALFDADAESIDILVTDVIMPKMNGPTMARRFLSVRPNLPVLFISGHANVEASLLGLERPSVGFLAKPVRIEQLAAKVGELLALNRT
jgi:signal transduction histidine kinase